MFRLKICRTGDGHVIQVNQTREEKYYVIYLKLWIIVLEVGKESVRSGEKEEERVMGSGNEQARDLQV